MGSWPTNDLIGNTTGIAVDPDGKVWVCDYYAKDSLLQSDSTWFKVQSILIFNPDGTPAVFSPIRIASGNGIHDTLLVASRGLRKDIDGNILYVNNLPGMYRFNYKTGEAMNFVYLNFGQNNNYPTTPAIDSLGNIYIQPVLPGASILEYDKNFNFVRALSEIPTGYASTSVISGDGMTYYKCDYSNNGIKIYHRQSEFDPFILTDSLTGFKTESATWYPTSFYKDKNYLWVSSGATGYADPGVFNNNYQLSSNAWYAIDLKTKTLKDSLFWILTGGNPASERPMAIDFSPDGLIAYAGCFGNDNFPLIQKFNFAYPSFTPVVFQVDMNIQQLLGNFNPATDKVVVRGNFQTDAGDVADWSGALFECKDPDKDKIYTYTVLLPWTKAGTTYEYKYVIIRNGVDIWENLSNRTFTFTLPTQILNIVYFNNVGVGTSINLHFVCNMEYEISQGRFDPQKDTLFLSGDFNNWITSRDMMPNSFSSHYYEKEFQYPIAATSTINYKFGYKKNGNIVWEDDPNKSYTISEDDSKCDYALIYRTFNNLTDPGLYPVYNFTIKFTVNMDSAKTGYGNPFGKIENVVLAGSELPLQWPSSCWPESDYQKIISLRDDGTNGDLIAGDNIWSYDISFDKYSNRIIQYRYSGNFAWPGSSSGCFNNEAFNNERDYNHFIILPNDIISATVRDTFGIMGYKPVYDLVTVDVNESRIRNYSFSLEQNFPNPFNPSTTISYEIGEPGFVALKIYNTLGQEVETLVTEFKQTGSYNAEWSASKNHLSSGIYFYQLTQGSNIVIKKMILLR